FDKARCGLLLFEPGANYFRAIIVALVELATTGIALASHRRRVETLVEQAATFAANPAAAKAAHQLFVGNANEQGAINLAAGAGEGFVERGGLHNVAGEAVEHGPFLRVVAANAFLEHG